jgi:hypothetical protein
MSFEESTNANHEYRIKRCRGCNAQVIWFETPAGSRMPVDAATVEPEDFELDLTRHISHFATCPDHAKFRKKK